MNLDRKRLVHLLGMMGSEHDGEALNAARLATRMQRDSKATWEEILAEVEASQEDLWRAWNRGYAAGMQPHPRPASPPPQAAPAAAAALPFWQFDVIMGTMFVLGTLFPLIYVLTH